MGRNNKNYKIDRAKAFQFYRTFLATEMKTVNPLEKQIQT